MKKYPNLLRFNLQIPFIDIHISIMRHSYEMRIYHYVAWHIQIWKWKWIVDYGKEK